MVDDSKDGCRRGKASVPLGKGTGLGCLAGMALGGKMRGIVCGFRAKKAGTFMFICHSYHLPILIGPTTCAVDLPCKVQIINELSLKTRL